MAAKLIQAAVLMILICASGCSREAARNPGHRSDTTTSPGGSTGWGSSGGELLGDMQNPWWVRNTEEIRYCIQIDAAGVTPSRGVLEEITDRALAYWKQEFSRELKVFGNGSELNALFAKSGVGRQRQIKIACDGSEDLRIQFGYGTLTPEQKAYLPDPRHYVGVAVRTSYDPVSMHGKGFILIASDRGPDALRREDLVKEPWRFSPVLFQILLHEIGHVYGVPHLGSAYTFMSQQFPEAILDKGLEPHLAAVTLEDTTSFFVPPENAQMCEQTWMDPKAVREFFSLPELIHCLRFDQDPAQPLVTVSASMGFGAPYYAIGAMGIAGFELHPMPVVPLRFPDAQTVFTQDEISSMTWIGGPFMASFELSTQYFPGDGREEKPLMLELGPAQVSAIAEVDGKLVRFIDGTPNQRLTELLGK